MKVQESLFSDSLKGGVALLLFAQKQVTMILKNSGILKCNREFYY